MAVQTRPKVLIIGGGITGLALAIGLQQQGIATALFERARRWQDLQLGAVLNVQVNGMRALQHLNLLDRIRASVLPIEEHEFLSWDGSLPLGSWPAAKMAGAYRVPDGLITRSALHKALVDALAPGTARLASECTGFTQDADGVTARFADGHEARGDVLIGADGLRSRVRQQLLGPHATHATGYSLWRGYTLSAVPQGPRGRTKIYMGYGAWFGLYPQRRDRMTWYSIAPTTPDSSQPGKEAMLVRHRGWDELVLRVIEATDASAIANSPVADHLPLDHWGSGRVTLIGDAAHAMPNTIAQGASQGLEDVVVLARALATAADALAALRAYEARRIPRANEVQARSQRLGAMFVSASEMQVYFSDAEARAALQGELSAQYEADMAYPFV